MSNQRSEREDRVKLAVLDLSRRIVDVEQDPIGAFQAIADEALDAFDASLTGVFLPRNTPGETRDLVAVAASGEKADEYLGLVAPVGETNLGDAFKADAPTVIGDIQAEAMHPMTRAYGESLEVHSAMILPLRPRGMLVISAAEPDHFSTRDIALAECFASLAVAARDLSERVALHERERLMAELHDGAVQVLYGALIDAECGLASDSLEEPRRVLEEVSELLRASLAELRELVLSAGSRRLTLFDRIRQSAQLLGRRGEIELELNGEDLLGEDLRTEDLFRIQLEAVSNAIRHGKAGRVLVSVESTDDGVRLTVEDDGSGFDVAGESHGIGLTNMPKRAKRIGGVFEIESEPGRGTTVRVTADGVS